MIEIHPLRWKQTPVVKFRDGSTVEARSNWIRRDSVRQIGKKIDAKVASAKGIDKIEMLIDAHRGLISFAEYEKEKVKNKVDKGVPRMTIATLASNVIHHFFSPWAVVTLLLTGRMVGYFSELIVSRGRGRKLRRASARYFNEAVKQTEQLVKNTA